jgi:hypothetical protein
VIDAREIEQTIRKLLSQIDEGDYEAEITIGVPDLIYDRILKSFADYYMHHPEEHNQPISGDENGFVVLGRVRVERK